MWEFETKNGKAWKEDGKEAACKTRRERGGIAQVWRSASTRGVESAELTKRAMGLRQSLQRLVGDIKFNHPLSGRFISCFSLQPFSSRRCVGCNCLALFASPGLTILSITNLISKFIMQRSFNSQSSTITSFLCPSLVLERYPTLEKAFSLIQKLSFA